MTIPLSLQCLTAHILVLSHSNQCSCVVHNLLKEVPNTFHRFLYIKKKSQNNVYKGCLDVVVLAHVTADVCVDGRKKLFAFRINPYIDLLSFNSAFKNAAFLKHFIQNVLLFWRHPGDERLGRYACSQGGNKQTRAFCFLFFFCFQAVSMPSVCHKVVFRIPAAFSCCASPLCVLPIFA